MSGESSLLMRATTPNSVSIAPKAPASTAMPMMYSTVLMSRSKAVFIMVLSRLIIPILWPIRPKIGFKTPRNTKASTLTAFFWPAAGFVLGAA